MAKRKNEDQEDGGSSSDASIVDVDFEFFGPNADVDYQALKRLLRQLFQQDAEMFHLHDLVELILAQPGLGTTVKTDGEESDPLAILTMLNLHVHQNHPSIKALCQYLLKKSEADSAFHSTLQALLSQSESHVAVVLCERLVNMPVQVIPPMYRMVIDELKYAIDEGEPFTFSHLLFVSRAYHLSLDEEALLSPQSRTSSKKSKKKKNNRVNPSSARPGDGLYSFHPEDEAIRQASVHTLDYRFDATPTEPRDNESFGLDTRGRMMLMPMERFPELVTKMMEVYGAQ